MKTRLPAFARKQIARKTLKNWLKDNVKPVNL